MREGAQLLEAGGRGTAHQFIDHPPADAARAGFARDHQRSDFGRRAAQRREISTDDDATVGDGDDESVDVRGDVRLRSRQQVPFGQMLGDQLEDRLCVRGETRADRDIGGR
jgi:hypothetical protein